MSFRILSLALLLFAKGQGFFRTRKFRFNLKKCTIKYCSGTQWKDNWQPGVPQGKCVKQTRASQGLYSSKTVVLPKCPSTISCPSEKQSRTTCKYTKVLLCLYWIDTWWVICNRFGFLNIIFAFGVRGKLAYTRVADMFDWLFPFVLTPSIISAREQQSLSSPF